MTVAKNFKDQGYPVPLDFFWMRLHVRMTPGAERQAITLDQGSYQLFVNGRLVGQQGGMPDHPGMYHSILQVFPIPTDAVRESTVIAARYWFSTVQHVDELGDPLIRLGEKSVLDLDRRSNLDKNLFLFTTSDVNHLVFLMIGLWALFRVQTRYREYLWLGTAGLIGAALAILTTVSQVSTFALWLYDYLPILLYTLYTVSLILFVCAFLQVRVNWMVRLYCTSWLVLALTRYCAEAGLDRVHHRAHRRWGWLYRDL
ncbi:MAG: hypothetical protein ABR910_01200 [Acidobacteriaceae bacterium]|jgi:hypothetical protein